MQFVPEMRENYLTVLELLHCTLFVLQLHSVCSPYGLRSVPFCVDDRSMWCAYIFRAKTNHQAQDMEEKKTENKKSDTKEIITETDAMSIALSLCVDVMRTW